MTFLLLHLYISGLACMLSYRASWVYVFPWQFRLGVVVSTIDMAKLGVVIFNDDYFSHEGLAALKWASDYLPESEKSQLVRILLVKEVDEQSQTAGNNFLSYPHHLLWSCTVPTCIFCQATHAQIFLFAYLFLRVILQFILLAISYFALHSSLCNFSYWTWLTYTLPTRRYMMCLAWSLI